MELICLPGSAHNSKRLSHSIPKQLRRTQKETQAVTPPKATTAGPSAESNIVILSHSVRFKIIILLCCDRKRTEARYFESSNLYPSLNFERHTETFLNFCFPCSDPPSSTLLFIISGEHRRTGFDNDD